MVTNYYSVVILSMCVSYASVTTPDSDCKIVGGDTQNYESLQPTDMTGYFSYPIPCNGTLVAVSATGFCILTERTHQQVSLFLIIYWEDNGIPMTTLHVLPADCDFAKNYSVSGIDYSFGSISHNDLNIPVTSDEFLSIVYFTVCTGSGCFFQPAVMNDTSKHMLFFLEYGKPVSETEIISNVSLLFSATIVSESNGQQDLYTADPMVNVGMITTVAVVATLLLIVFTTITLTTLTYIYRYRKRRDEIPAIPVESAYENPFRLKTNQAYDSVNNSSHTSPDHVYDELQVATS